MVRWTWWDWSLSLWLLLPSVLWHCWLGHLTCKKTVPEMTYNVFSGTLNPAQSQSHRWHCSLSNHPICGASAPLQYPCQLLNHLWLAQASVWSCLRYAWSTAIQCCLRFWQDQPLWYLSTTVFEYHQQSKLISLLAIEPSCLLKKSQEHAH